MAVKMATMAGNNDLDALAAHGNILLLTILAKEQGVFMKIMLSFLENKVDRAGAEDSD
jgi:hypothetical protein